MEKINNVGLSGLILGVSLIISVVIIANTLVSIKNMDNVLSVVGSTKQKVVADNARWSSSFSHTATKDELKNAYAQMKNDEKNVMEFFTSQGFAAENIEISPVYMNEIYKNDSNSPREYNLVQTIQVRSTDVNKLKELAKNSDQIANKGIIFSAGSVEYTYSKLAESRISLLPEAINDAKARAEMIAKNSDKKVKSIKSVSMGVVQVLAEGSQDVSDYGSYDLSTINKEVMVTVKVIFDLK